MAELLTKMTKKQRQQVDRLLI